MKLPIHFIIIGAQKAASSFVQNCLSDHPDVWMPHGETAYFQSPDYEQTEPSAFVDGLAGGAGQRIGIKRPDYLASVEAAERIQRLLPKAKLICILRHPVDRAISAWYHNIKAGFLPVISAEIGISSLLKGEQSLLKDFPRAAEVLDYGLYHKHLKKYSRAIENGNMLLLRQEDVIRNPLDTFKLTSSFLGLDFVPPSERVLKQRPQAVIYDLRRLRLLQYRPKLLYNFCDGGVRSIGRNKSPIRLAGAAAVVAFDQFVMERLFGNAKPTLSAELKNRLQEFYEPTIRGLRDDYAIPVEDWLQ